MKPISYTIATAFVIIIALAIGWMMASHYKRCPEPIAPGPSKEDIARQHTRDSIDVASAVRKHIQDSLASITPEQRNENSLRIARSISRAAQRDSMLAEPS